jgi:uncharacterized protein (TIGR00645 family)
MVERLLRKLLFASRWLLAPLYVGVALCLLALVFQAGQKLYQFGTSFLQQSESATLLMVLGIVDLTLTGSLLVLVIFSGYENFISRVEDAESRTWPEWMARIDFAGLKLKLMSSLVAISAVRLLEAFMNIEHETQTNLAWYIGIHLTFVVSSLALALSERLSDDHKDKNGSH